jgi:hypothetical protein
VGKENYLDNMVATEICKTQNPFISKLEIMFKMVANTNQSICNGYSTQPKAI